MICSGEGTVASASSAGMVGVRARCCVVDDADYGSSIKFAEAAQAAPTAARRCCPTPCSFEGWPSGGLRGSVPRVGAAGMVQEGGMARVVAQTRRSRRGVAVELTTSSRVWGPGGYW